jgi:type II secretory pathway pseudopilin PulG
MELLVVIAIIAVVTGIALPSIKAFKPQPLNAATTQFLNDLAYARRRAIADHTTVYVAFMPPTSALSNLNVNSSYLTPQLQQKLLKSQYIGYAMYEKRTVGDQPGASQPHWITDWRRLPDGTGFPPQMFLGNGVGVPPSMNPVGFSYWSFDYRAGGEIIVNPETNNPAYQVKTLFPTIAFDYRGSLVPPWKQWKPTGVPPDPPPAVGTYVNYHSGQMFDCVIPITQGNLSVLGTNWTPGTFRENPVGSMTNIYNHIVIDGTTGRARVDKRQL